MIVLDTSVLVESLTGPKHCALALRNIIERGERLLLPSIVLYEWLRGLGFLRRSRRRRPFSHRTGRWSFGPREAELSAQLYRGLRRGRGREIDLAIAAVAIVREAALWTMNTADFRDIPNLQLISPPGRAG